jgi:hypothetical protein
MWLAFGLEADEGMGLVVHDVLRDHEYQGERINAQPSAD